MRRGAGARRIVMVIGTANLGGAEGQMTRLAAELKQRGEDVRLAFLNRGGPLTTRLDEAGVWWRPMAPQWLPSSTLRRMVALVRLAILLSRTRPDVVVAWLPGAIMPTLPLARVFAPRARRVAGLRGTIFDDEFRLTAPLLRSAMRRADAVTINSSALAELATRWGAPPDRIRLLVNGVTPPSQRAHPEIEPPTAVVVANYRWYKGHDTLLKALSTVRSPLQVRLCGEGDPSTVERVVAELGLGDRVHLVPTPADIPRELAAAQLAIHPSNLEGMSNAILEQVATGLPVVATDVGATRLMVRDGVNGLVVAPGDHEAMSQAVERLAADAPLRVRMGAESVGVSEQFLWPQCVAAYQALFDEIVGGPR
jgi:glycosyltransferase involved in cell wall biosynthesis